MPWLRRRREQYLLGSDRESSERLSISLFVIYGIVSKALLTATTVLLFPGSRPLRVSVCRRVLRVLNAVVYRFRSPVTYSNDPFLELWCSPLPLDHVAAVVTLYGRLFDSCLWDSDCLPGWNSISTWYNDPIKSIHGAGCHCFSLFPFHIVGILIFFGIDLMYASVRAGILTTKNRNISRYPPFVVCRILDFTSTHDLPSLSLKGHNTNTNTAVSRGPNLERSRYRNLYSV